MTTEQEWAALEAEQQRIADDAVNGIAIHCAPKRSNRPHPLSYRPDLPLAMSERANNEPRVRKSTKIRTKIRTNAPHPDSYRPDIPLDGFTDAQLVKPTKEDKAIWIARPLVMIPAVYVPCEPCKGKGSIVGKTCRPCQGKGLRRGVTKVPAVATPVAALVEVAAPKRAKTVKAEKPAPRASCRSQPERDAIRRAYIAFLKGRAALADNAQWLIDGKRLAPWSAIVVAAFPDPNDFQRAAEAWKSPKNQRTLETH